MAQVSGQMSLKIDSILHDNPGDFHKIVIQIWKDGGFPGDVCGEGSAVACKIFDPPRTLATCTTTNGTIVGPNTCKWEDTLTFDTSLFPNDGWQQFRVRGKVDEPDGTEMRTSTGLHAYLSNGNPVNHVYEPETTIEARGWYTNAEYAVSNIKEVARNPGPFSGVWAPKVQMKEGSGGIAVTEHRAALDAAIHAGNLGTLLTTGAGEYRERVVVDTKALSDGWHKLFLRTSQDEPLLECTNSAVMVYFFEVLNNASNPAFCEMMHSEPPIQDTYIRGGSTYGDSSFGSDSDIVIKGAGSDHYTRIAYLQFDLSHLPSNAVFDSAHLSFNVDYHQSEGTVVPLSLYSATDNWDESTLTWNNSQVVTGALLGTLDVEFKGTVSYDLTAYLNGLSLGQVISFELKDSSNVNKMLKFDQMGATLDFKLSSSSCPPAP